MYIIILYTYTVFAEEQFNFVNSTNFPTVRANCEPAKNKKSQRFGMSMQRSVQALPPEKATCMRRHGAAYGRQRLTQTDRLMDGQTDETRREE